jgi:hypothetical protein
MALLAPILIIGVLVALIVILASLIRRRRRGRLEPKRVQ